MIRQNKNEVVFDFPMMRDPRVASSLSLIPGLGQIYNSEPRKGVLFFMVALTNMMILATLTFNKALINSLQAVGHEFNITPNREIVDALSAYHAGSPACNVLLMLFLAFIAFSMRDAFDRAKLVRRNTIYAPSVMHISEAASTSYLFHNVLMATLVIFAFFFLLPAPPQVQITEIQFVNPIQPTNKPPRTNNRAIIEADRLRSKSTPRDARDAGASAPPASSNASTSVERSRPKVENHPQKQPNLDSQPKRENIQTKPAPTAEPIKTETKATVPDSAPPMPIPVNKPVLSTPSALLPPTPLTKAASDTVMNKMPTLKAPSNSPHAINDATKLLNNLTPASAPTKIASAFTPGQLTVKSGASSAPPALPNSGAIQTPGTSLQPGVSESSSKRDSGSVREPKGREHGTGNKQLAMTGGPADGPSPKRSGTKGNDLPGFTGWKPDVKSAGDGKEDSQDRGGGCTVGGGKDDFDQDDSHDSVDFGPYMAQLQRRIRANWFPPKDSSTKKVIARFTVSKNGGLSGLRLVVSSGSALGDSAALKAVSNAAPFANLPKGSPESVDIEFTFDYRVYNGAGSVLNR